MVISTLDDLKAQLSFTDDIGVTDDVMLTRMLASAEGFIERKLGFKFADTFGGVGQEALPGALVEAVLMLAAHWYENREATAEAAREPPFGVSEIIREFRGWTF
jgi:uncharacterized phage protein (predicted DNA packaging)